MKKIVLTESQLKNIIDKILVEQLSEPMIGNQDGEESWKLCGYQIIKSGNDFYCENKIGELLKLPRLSNLTGTIQKEGNGTVMVFDDEVYNGLEIGLDMKRDIICYNTMPMQYQGATTNGRGGGWFVFIDDLSKQLKEPTPIYSIFTWNGSLGVGKSPMLERLKDKDGVTIKYQTSRTPTYILEISPALPGKKIYIDEPNTTTDVKPELEEIKLDIQSPFEFDKVTLTPNAEIEFKSFVEKVKMNYKGVSGTVEVLCSASIDADETQKKEYNQRLSDKRALTISNRLKSEIGIDTLTFVPKGIGQTDQFAKGMKYPEVKDVNKTAPNRRLIIKMPTLTREKK